MFLSISCSRFIKNKGMRFIYSPLTCIQCLEDLVIKKGREKKIFGTSTWKLKVSSFPITECSSWSDLQALWHQRGLHISYLVNYSCVRSWSLGGEGGYWEQLLLLSLDVSCSESTADVVEVQRHSTQTYKHVLCSNLCSMGTVI